MRFKLKSIFVGILFVLLASVAYAADPVLYFSDLTSGPKTGLGDGSGSGAIVTIWGANLGSSQGTSTITVCGSTNAHIYEWQNATIHDGHPSDLYTFHKMQVIMFSIPSDAGDGTGTISVSVKGRTSNTLPFTIRSGSIFWVSAKGDDKNAGSFSMPWRHPGYYWGSNGTAPGVSAGSICYVKDSVLVEDSDNSGYGVENYRTGGTEALPYFMTSYPGAEVVFQGTYKAFGSGYNMGLTGVYGHLSKVTLKAPSGAYTYIEHGNLIGCEITDHPTSPCNCNQSGLITSNGAPGISTSSGINGNRIIGNYIHDYCANLAGDKQQHTMYLSNRFDRENAEGFEIGWNYLDNNWGNGGIHVYDEGACTNWNTAVEIHDNVVVDQRGWAIGFGPGCSTGYGPITSQVYIYNNLIIRGGRGPSYDNKTTSLLALSVGGSTMNGNPDLQQYEIYVNNNTIYGVGEDTETGRDISTGNPIIKGSLSIGNAESINFKNNIVYDTNDYPWLTNNSRTPHTGIKNLWFSAVSDHETAPSWDTSALNVSPLFQNLSVGDFRLQSESPAINTGDHDSVLRVTADFLGTPRPSNAIDIGAFEYFDDQRPWPPTGLHIIE